MRNTLAIQLLSMCILLAGCDGDVAMTDAGDEPAQDAGPGAFDDAGPLEDAGALPDADAPGEDGGALAVLGASCGAATECASGQCVDGVCCDVACDGACEGCAVPDSVGTCTAYAAGSDPESECGGGVCDGAAVCAVGDTRWASSYSARAGSLNHTFVNDVAVDATGVVAVGSFRGVVDFGGGNLVAGSGRSDMFVARYDAAGAHVSSVRFTTNLSGRNTSAEAVALTATGSAIVVGHYDGVANSGVNFAGNVLPHAGGRDVFVAEIGADGSVVRAAGFGGTGSDVAHDVAVAADGRILVGGEIGGSMVVGSQTLPHAGGRDAFVMSLGADLTPAWALASGGARNERVNSLATDSTGAVIVAGELASEVAFGGTPVLSQGFDDVFLGRIDAAGVLDWLAGFGDGAGMQTAQSVAVGPSDEIVLAGYLRGGADFGGGALAAQGTTLPDFFVASFGTDGTHRWSTLYGDDDLQNRIAVDVDDRGILTVATGYEGVLDLGGGPITSAGQNDVSVSRLAADGTHLWTRSFGDGFDQYAQAVAVDADGSAVVVGKLLGTIDFGPGALSDNGAGFAMFVARFDP